MGLCVLSALLLMQNNSVRAAFGNAHAIVVLYRVETEIMQKTPAGQYYESLFWKHNDELMRIAQSYPERDNNFWRVTRLFIPELEALLNGDGDKAYITSEHVESLKAELDWFASVGSPAFSEDIRREQQRFPLDAFVGMTMIEALDFINSNWSPDIVVEKNLIPDSDGKWAYYVHNGVYLEYPSVYNLQTAQAENNFVYFMPTAGMSESWDACVVKVLFWNIPASEKETKNPRSWRSPESIVWESVVANSEFQGAEFISINLQSSGANIHAFQYNEENQIAVEIWVFVTEKLPTGVSFNYSEMISQRYEYFQHMANSLRMWKP